MAHMMVKNRVHKSIYQIHDIIYGELTIRNDMFRTNRFLILYVTMYLFIFAIPVKC